MFYRSIKKNKGILSVAFVAMICLSLALLTFASAGKNEAYAATEGSDCAVLTYVANGENYTVTGIDMSDPYNIANETTLTIVIPATHQGKNVTAIGESAFNASKIIALDLSGAHNLTSIGANAFSGCNGLTGTLTIPGSVISIGERAFEKCRGFTGALTIPNSVTSIGEKAFENCSGFNGTLTISDNVTSIETSVFSGCNGLTGELTIPNGVTSIGDGAFWECIGLTGELTIPENVTTIGAAAFGSCSFTGALTIPNSVTSIGLRAFEKCRGFNGTLTISNNVTSIGAEAFSRCSGFTGDLTIPDSVISIEDMAFESCSGFNGTLTISNNVTSIGLRAFSGCSGLTGDLTIPGSLTATGDGVFKDCSGFTGNLTISEGVISIGGDAFRNSGFRGDLILPDSVTSIGRNAFLGCSGFTGNLRISGGLKSIKNEFRDCRFRGTLTITEGVTSIGEMAFMSCGFTGALKIPDSVTSIGDMAFFACSDFTGDLRIPSNVTSIGVEAFSECEGLTGTLTIPNSVTSIGDGAFEKCSGLTGALTIPNNVTSIGNNVFAECKNFSSITIPNNVTSIGLRAFLGCSGLKGTLTIPNSVTSIGDSAFSGCSGLWGALTIPNSVTSIGNSAFENCSGLTGTLTIPGSVTNIGNSAFENCSGLKGALTIPNNVTSIGNSAFKNCSGLTGDLTIPGSVTNIGNNAFEYCCGFTGNLIIPGSVTNIKNYTFNGCYGFTGALTIPNSVTSIGDFAFSSCKGFTGDLTIPESVTNIGANAFNGCSGFTGELTIPSSVTSIKNNTFNGCSGFTGELTIPNSVTSIGDLAFLDCSGFTGNLTIPGSVTSIGSSAFNGCSGFTGTLTIPESVTIIENDVFKGCSGFTGDLTISNGVTSIGSGAFENCSGFTGNLTIPGSVISIGTAAFVGSGFKGNLTIADGVTSIMDRAFNGCGFTGSLTVPDSVTSIGAEAFRGCIGFTGTLILPKGMCTIREFAFLDSGFRTVYLPDENTAFSPYVFGHYDTDLCGLLVAPSKSIYDLYLKLASEAEQDQFFILDVNYLTYETSVTLVANGGSINGAESVALPRLFGFSIFYEKNADTLVWAENTGCRFPAPVSAGYTFGAYQNNGDDITAAPKVTEGMVYTATWTLDAPEIAGGSGYSGAYDAGAHGISVTASHNSPGATLTYQWYKRAETDILLDGATEAELRLTNVSDSGVYYCIVSVSDGSQTNAVTGADITVSITPLEAVLSWSIPDLTYDGAAKTANATVANLKGSDSCAVTIQLVSGQDNINVGGFAYVATGLENGNYVLPADAGSGTFTIVPKTIVIIWCEDDFAYNGLDRRDDVKASYTDVNGKNKDLSVTGSAFKNCAQGEVLFTVSFANNETNYALPDSVSQAYRIKKLAVTVKADDAVMIYGDGLPTLTWSYVDGSAQFVAADHVTLKVNTDATQASPANGTYYTEISVAELDNYTVTCQEGVMTVEKRRITVTVDNAESIYGDALSALTARITSGSVVNGDTDIYSLATTAAATSPIGNGYTVTGKGENTNYDITFVPATYTLNARTLTKDMVAEIANVVYSGQPIEPIVTIADGDLLKASDYKIEYSEHIDAGQATVLVTAQGNYTGAFKVYFTIDKANHDVSGVIFASGTVVENGEAHSLAVTGTLPSGVTVAYTGNGKILPGVYEVTARFIVADTKNYNEIQDVKTATLTVKVKQVQKEDGDVMIDAGDVGIAPDAVVEIVHLDEQPQADFGKYEDIFDSYEISLKKAGAAVQPDGILTVRLLIDESYRDKAIRVYRIDSGVKKDMNAVRDGDYMVFTTDSLSVFSMTTEKPTAEKDGKNNTGLVIGLSVGGSALVFMTASAVVFIIKRKMRRP